MLLAKKPRYSFDRAKYEQDLYSVLSPITWFCKVFGIFPLRIKEMAGKKKYTTSYILICYNVTTMTIAIIALSISLWIADEKMMKLQNRIVIMASLHFEFLIGTWSTIVMNVTAIITRDKFIYAIDTLSLQDTTLRKLGTKLDYASDLKQNYMRLGINILVYIVIFTSDFFFQLKFNLRYPIIWTALTYPIVVRIFSICLFADVLFALRQRFAALNKHLRKILEETKYLSPEAISTPDNNSDRLRLIARIHGALCEVASNVNKTFGLNIIIGVVFALKMLITAVFYIAQEIEEQMDIRWMEIAGYLNWGILGSAQMVYVVTACKLVQDEASLAGKLVHKFHINEGATPFNTILQSFSLQLYHKRIEFTAAGIFPLDATLFQSIVGAVATFLVILLQFNISIPKDIE